MLLGCSVQYAGQVPPSCVVDIEICRYVPVIDIEICRSGKKDFCLDIGCVPEHLQAAFMVSVLYVLSFLMSGRPAD